MAKQLPCQSSGTPVVTVEDSGIMLPTFSFVNASTTALDDVDTDLVLVTKLYRMAVPATLHVQDADAGEFLRRTVKDEFPGKKGTSKLLQLRLRNSHGENRRHVLLAGLGAPSSYCGKIACSVFELFISKALDLHAESVLVPFAPNPMTKDSLTHKATAFKLKSVLSRVAKERGGLDKLREVKIYCVPAAVRHIASGLKIHQGDGCHCGPRRRKRSGKA